MNHEDTLLVLLEETESPMFRCVCTFCGGRWISEVLDGMDRTHLHCSSCRTNSGVALSPVGERPPGAAGGEGEEP